jgi:tetratricopeptide (TPR) repeat protein
LTPRTNPPSPHGVRTVEELVDRLRQLRAWSGMPYRAVHREVLRLRSARGVPERPVYNTIYRCFQVDRIRLDVEVVVDIAQVLLGDESRAASWRQACQVIEGAVGAAQIVDVTGVLPEESGDFTGRAADLRTLVERRGVTVIDGMAGVGKTRLAVHAAHRIAADVRLSVDLRGFDPNRPPADSGAVLDGFLRCLGVSGDQVARLDRAERAAKYRQLLTGRRAVVLLDNAATVEQVNPLLPTNPESVAIITSRHELDIADAEHITLAEFTADEVGEFLRSGRTDVTPAEAHEIGRLVAYLPLALAIVAARINASPEWTVADHLERLDQQRRNMRLDEGVESAFALSYQDLPADVRRTFLLLALHPGTEVERYSAAALTSLDLNTVYQHLNDLHTAHLLQQKAPGRYTFHDLIRVFATGRTHDELPASIGRVARARLLDYYVSACAQAMGHLLPTDEQPETPVPDTELPIFDDVSSAAEWLDAEQANLLAAAIYADENARSDITRLLSALIGRYLHESGRFRDAEVLHTRALHTARGGERSRELSRLGAITARLGRWAEAVGWFEMALAVAHELDDWAQERRALNGLGNCFWALDRLDDALDCHRQALEIARRRGDRAGEGRTLGNIGAVYERSGRYADAVSMFERSLHIARELGDHDDQLYAANNLVTMCIRLGRLDDAEVHCKQAVAISRKVGSRYQEATSLGNLAELYGRLGRYDEALDLAQSAVSLSRETDDRAGECVQLSIMGGIYQQAQQYDEALRTLRRALDIAIEVDVARVEMSVRTLIGETLLRSGSPTQAIDFYREALTAAEETHALDRLASAHRGLGDALSATGDRAGAESHWRGALLIYTDLGVPEAEEIRARLDQKNADRRRSSS